jgi:hypothetical protein
MIFCFSSSVFAKLKCEALDPDSDLNGIRTRAQQIVSGGVSASPIDDFHDCCICVWKTLSGRSDSLLPPIYICSALDRTLREFTSRLFELELGNKDPGGGTILHGCKGVGKTLVLGACGVFAAVLCARVVPVFHDFSDGTKPPFPAPLIAQALGVPFSPSDQLPDAMAAAMSAKKSVLLLLDEFAVLYNFTGEAAIARCKRILADLVGVAKVYANTLVLMTTSHSDVTSYIEPTGRIAAHGYPNLNERVFIPRRVRPLRSVAAVRSYLEARFLLPFSEDAAAAVLHRTGGVGALIADDELVRAKKAS